MTPRKEPAIGPVILFSALVFSVLLVWINSAFGAWGSWSFVALIVLGVLAYFWNNADNAKRRFTHLMNLYGNESVVRRILDGEVWQGETDDQLRQSLGDPEGVDESVNKEKRTQVWKYSQTGKNRYRLRVSIENGAVVGWDKKDA